MQVPFRGGKPSAKGPPPDMPSFSRREEPPKDQRGENELLLIPTLNSDGVDIHQDRLILVRATLRVVTMGPKALIFISGKDFKS